MFHSSHFRIPLVTTRQLPVCQFQRHILARLDMLVFKAYISPFSIPGYCNTKVAHFRVKTYPSMRYGFSRFYQAFVKNRETGTLAIVPKLLELEVFALS